MLIGAGCGSPPSDHFKAFSAEDLRAANRKLLETTMEDGFSPPVASRVYVYPHLAHYLTLSLFQPDGSMLPMAMDGLGALPAKVEGAHDQLSALLAFSMVGRSVVFTEDHMQQLYDRQLAQARENGLPDDMIDASEKLAAEIAVLFKTWMDRDGYIHTRTLDRFTSTKAPGHWLETPPDYTAALEPHWGIMRPIMIDSSLVRVELILPPYSSEKGSDFHKIVLEVYNGTKELNDSMKAIALYWDDNPNISSHRGHLVTQEHRIAPPGHWLNIISQVTRAQGSDVHRTSKAYALAAVAMYDGIVLCWNEKFSTDVVRPITYIQRLIDPEWSSLIQTPPFPEYPSAHSVSSAAAATVLDHVLGADVAFTDSTEALFGLGVRQFANFQDAAWQVSMSRFYGGIHYMRSVEEGNRQGREIGQLVMERLKKK